MRTPTKEEFKKFCRENKELALTVCKAKAYAEIKREQVDKYIEPIFKLYKFPVVEGWTENYGPFVKTPDDLYLTDLDSDIVKEYYENCDAEHRKHGFKGKKGHCPALEAEWLLIQAENALLEVGKVFMGIEDVVLCGDNRKKMLDLLLGACLNIDKKGGK